ncbi:MAG: Ig-like domain-containing protein [Prosthecobacter sp.]|uniref:Ig-like domain-containing protein n=1 Tax=Prosthecobacter sp. TaxID=1965333 RepID=UPI0039014D4C
MKYSCLLFALFPFASSAWAAGFPNINRPTAGALLTPTRVAATHGRTAVIAWHNGLVYTMPESPGSAPGSDVQARSWDFANPAAPVELENLGTTHHPVQAHGYFYRNNQLVIGNNGFPNPALSMVFAATATYGVNTRGPFTELNPQRGAGGRGAMFHPFLIEPTFWIYSDYVRDAFIRRHNTQTGQWQNYAVWDHLSLTGVIGHPIMVGNLLFMPSDQSRTGLAIYDISDLNNPVLLSTLTDGGPGGYWPSMWGGGGRLYAVWPYRRDFTDSHMGFRMVDVTDPTDPQWIIDKELPDEDETMYVMFQDDYAFMGNHKIDLRSKEVVLSLATEANGMDASQFALPVGNLVIAGGYGNQQGMSVWVHDTAADTRPPEVGYHIPRDGQTNYPVTSPISLLIHETLETRSIINGDTILIRPVGGAPLAAQFARTFDGVVTFTPDSPLAANTTYEVVLDGIEDAAGNEMQPYSFTFSTGSTVAGNVAPAITSLTANVPVIAPGGEITLTATATDAQAIEYRFDAGDGRPKTAWSTTASVAFTYADAGHYQPLVQARDPLGAVSSRSLGINVLTVPAGPRPTASSAVAIHAASRLVWSVNPDANTVTVVHADTLAVLAEIAVEADPRSIALDAAGNAWVTCHDADRVMVLAAANGAVLANIDTGYGSAPFGVAISPNGATAYVSLYGSGALRRFNTATRAQIGGDLALGHSARALAVSSDGSRVLVTRFISPKDNGDVWEVNASTFTLNRTLRLPKLGADDHRDGTANSRGVPNYLAAVTYSPDGLSAWVAATKQNTERGTLFNAAQTHDSTQRNLLLQIDLTAGSVMRDVDIDNSDSATALAVSPRGDYLFVTLQGNNQVVIFDLLVAAEVSGLGAMVTRQMVGAAPQGVAVDATTGRAFVQNFMGRSVSMIPCAPLFDTGSIALVTSHISTVNNELLSPAALAGKRIFYHADERMSAEGYISCASCHTDGGSDGRVWDFTQRGEGLRNTVELRGRSGMGHGAVHWSGNFDEIQDFENDIRGFFGGTGFLTNSQFAAAEHPLGNAKAGLSADLDALAAYVTSLGNEHLPRSPNQPPNVEAGRQVFSAMNCSQCHSGSALTDSTLRNVGTQRTTSGQRIGAALTGIDTPTLRGVWSNAPYFHDGSASTLEDVFTIAGGTVYQIETGSTVVGGNIPSTANGNILINWDNTVMGGVVALNANGTVTRSGIDGGTGGVGAVEIRYSAAVASAGTIRVNGVAYPISLINTGNAPAFRNTFWTTARAENVALTAGATNSIEISRTGGDWDIDHFTVSTPNDLALAAPHRSVPAAHRADLLAYVRSLDGSAVVVDAANAPSVIITPRAGQGNPVRWPFVEFDLVFSTAVTGLTESDLIVEGSAGATWVTLMPSGDGMNYRARFGGFTGNGNVSLRLNIGAASSSRAALPVSVDYLSPVPVVDPLASTGDEFSDAATLTTWQRLDQTEGWGANKLTTHEISSGRMRLIPSVSGFYQDYVGPYVFRNVTGDFIATVQMDVSRRNGAAGRPSSNFSIGGLMLRRPKTITNAGASPGGDWTAGAENSIAFNFGTADPVAQPNANQWQCVVSNTTNSVSNFYTSTQGIPLSENTVTMQIVRVGSTIVLLRQHPGGQWITEQRYTRADFPATLQIGLGTATNFTAIAGLTPFNHNRTAPAGGTPDVVLDAEWFRLSTPSAALTTTVLNALPVTGQFGPVQTLANSNLGATAATLPVVVDGQSYAAWLAANRTPVQLANPAFTDPALNLLDYLGTGGLTFNPPAAGSIELHLTRNANARGATLIIEESPDLVAWTPIATSLNGAPPTGTATVSEGSGVLRSVTLNAAAPAPRSFYRVRATLQSHAP